MEIRLKYDVLIHRIKKNAGVAFKQTLTNDLIVEKLGILKDFEKLEGERSKEVGFQKANQKIKGDTREEQKKKA